MTQAQEPQRVLETILVGGDYEPLPGFAEKMARALQDVRVHQVRRFFGEVQRIRMLHERESEEARRRLLMLRPRLAYQTKRQRGLRPLKEVVDRAVPLVYENMQERFPRFFDLVEAVVAYHGAYAKQE